MIDSESARLCLSRQRFSHSVITKARASLFLSLRGERFSYSVILKRARSTQLKNLEGWLATDYEAIAAKGDKVLP